MRSRGLWQALQARRPTVTSLFAAVQAAPLQGAKKAADLAEQERLEAERQDQASDIAARMLAAMKTTPAPGPTTAPDQPDQPQPTAPAPPRYLPARPPVEREEVVITIRQPTTFPGTPIRHG